MTDLKREQFEEHMRSLPSYSLFRYGEDYVDAGSQEKWELWQLAWQAAQASQQPADDGWIEWKGGESPVGEFDVVETKWCSGAIVEDCAGEFDWSFDADDFNIIAYRVVKP